MTLCAAVSAESTPAAPALAIGARGLGKEIDDRRILDDLTFEIPRGRCTALLGANGAGKSTLLRILACLVPASGGELRLFDETITRPTAAVRSRIGLIGHAPMLYRDLTAAENIELFARLYGVRQPRRRAAEMLEWVDLAARADDPVSTFSRGMVQRVAIARALVHDPDLLLADEPFSGLDAPSRAMLEGMLARVRDEGRTVLLASHDIHRSLVLADHVLVLRRGRLVLDRASRGLDAEDVLREVGTS